MSLSNVEFRGCKQYGLQLKSSCEIVNVTFVGCRFNRMAFMDVKLSNVVFKHIDFTDSAYCCLVLRNVTLTSFHFSNDLWRATHLENPLVGERSFKMRQGTTADCYLRAPAVSAKTIQFTTKDAKPLDKLNQELGHSGAWNLDIDCHFIPSSSDILTRLAKYGSIFDAIMGYCFPSSNVHICEYPCGSKILRESKMSKKLYSKRNGTKTTYFGSLKYGLSVGAKPSKNIPPRGVGECNGLLLAGNKKLSKLASKHLYSREFHLQCSAEGARDFLLAHAQQMKMAKAVVLYYHWRNDKVGLVTDIDAWRYLLGTIRHQHSFIPTIGLCIGPSFWNLYNPHAGANHVLSKMSGCPGPFTDVDKFAAPDDRWRKKGDESTHRSNGTGLQIHIQGARTPKQTNFSNELTEALEKRRVGRPLFVRSDDRKELTYQCAGQFWEDRWSNFLQSP